MIKGFPGFDFSILLLILKQIPMPTDSKERLKPAFIEEIVSNYVPALIYKMTKSYSMVGLFSIKLYR